MNKWALQIYLGMGLLFALTATANTEILPEKIFRMGAVELGKTTIYEIKTIYGNAESYRGSKDDGAEEYVCYILPHAKLKQYVEFETGEMGGYMQVIGFHLTAARPHGSCVRASKLPDKANNGVGIGDRYDSFLKKFSIVFKRNKKTSLRYENVSQRKATMDELVYLQKTFPSDKEAHFDITVNIDAHFRNGRLIDYHVRKIESY